VEEKGGDILVTKKDLTIVVLAALLLTAALFMIFPTRSSPSAGKYDPWTDIDANGNVNIVDISKVAKAFGTFGDPTRPVVITGYNYVENPTYVVLMNQTLTNITVSTAGYRMITVSLYAQSKDAHQFEIFWGYKIAGRFAYTTTQTLTSDTTIHVIKPIWYQNVHSPQFVLSLEITFSEFWLSINNNSVDRELIATVVYSLNA